MRHVPDGVLRRLEDEPFSVADSTANHVAGCRRCRARHQQIASTASGAHRWLSGPQLVPNVDDAWLRFRRALPANEQPTGVAATSTRHRGALRRRRGALAHPTTKVAVAGGLAGVVLAGGVAAAASFTPIFSPTRVAPLPVTRSDIRAVSDVLGLANGSSLGGFDTPNGSRAFRFGTLQWSSTGESQTVSSAARAEALSGLSVPSPAHLPAGVGQPLRYLVQRRVTATIDFNASAGNLAGTTVTMQLGPAVAVAYGSRTSQSEIPSLAIATIARPSATSSKATLRQIESFLLSRPGIPSQLAEEVRFFGGGSTVLPIPAPPGTTSHSVHVGRWPAVAVVAGSSAASALVWEDGSGQVHVIAGLVNEQSLLNVANQIN